MIVKTSNSGQTSRELPNGVTILFYFDAPGLQGKDNHQLHKIYSVLRPMHSTEKKGDTIKFSPELEYDRDSIISFSRYTKDTAIKMCQEFENAGSGEEKLLLQEFYDFFGYEYKVKKKFGDYISSVKELVSSLTIPSVLKTSPFSLNLPTIPKNLSLNYTIPSIVSTRTAIIVLCGAGISFTPLHSFEQKATFTSYENLENDYNSTVLDILNLGKEKVTVEYLMMLNKQGISFEDLSFFQVQMSNFIDKLSKLDNNSLDKGTMDKLLKGGGYDLLNLIDKIGSDRGDLQDLKNAITSLRDALAYKEIKHVKGPLDENSDIKIPLFWREEDELGEVKQPEISGP